MLINILVTAVLVVIFGGIGWYIYKSKKRGDGCIGCPYAKQCSGKCNGGCHSKEV